MKTLFSIVVLLMLSVAIVPFAEAKKFGSGKSFGQNYKTAPAPKQQEAKPTNQQQPTATQPTGRKGLMGGLLGGLLAGGLIAALLGGSFEGIQFMDIVIIGLLAFVIIKLMRGMLSAKQSSMNQYAPQTPYRGDAFKFEQPDATPNAQTGFGAQTDVPFRFMPTFDRAGFLNGAREHYRILQGAWNHNQLDTIEEYVAPSLFNELKAERESLGSEQHTEVMYVDAEFVRADYDANKAQVSLQFSGRYRDEAEGVEEKIEDIWHLERDLTTPNTPWLIVGIQG